MTLHVYCLKCAVAVAVETCCLLCVVDGARCTATLQAGRVQTLLLTPLGEAGPSVLLAHWLLLQLV
jgi:hypothetical protein